MKSIRLVDLATQYERISEEIDQAILEVVRSSIYIGGPQVAGFQEELEQYLNVKHVIPCANGTDALQLSLMALDLKPGDEVITPSFTYFATTEVCALLRLTPVFVDVEPDSFNLDPNKLEEAISGKTRAIIPVHLYGQCANMEPIMEIADRHSIPVIEDTAQAIGAQYTFSDGTKKYAGTIGRIGTTSFFPSKNLGAYGDGGAMFTNDSELAAKLKKVANHGQDKRYYHDLIGANSRLDAIQAAILRVKLKHFDSYIAARQQAAAAYDKAFEASPNIEAPHRSSFSDHTFHQYTMKLNNVDREGLMEFLTARDIPCNIYYPLANHKQKAFTEYGFRSMDLSVTEQLSDVVLSLPMHTELTADQLDYITSATLEYIETSLVKTTNP